MKTIKYLVAFLAAALMFNACEQEQGLSQQNKDKQKPTVSLVLNEANDVTLSFDVVASENAAQYAYAVFPGSDNEVPSAYDILLTETFAAAAEAFNTKIGEDASATASVTLDCSDFAAETYQIFAAAITETGLIGEVAVLDVTMNDTEIPVLAGAAVDANVLTLQFNEAVVRGNGKAYVTIIAWGVGQYYMMDEVITDENITVENNVVTIVCPEAGNGAGYIVSFEEGLVKDLSGNKCTAVKSGLDANYQYVGLGWDTDFVPITITESCFVEPAENTNWGAEDANLVFVLPTEVMINTAVSQPITVIYDEAEGVSQLYAEWTLGEDFKTVTVYLPKMPTGEFDVAIAEGAFYDIWGNPTSAFEPAALRYSNFLNVQIQTGYYAVDYVWDTEAGQEASQFLALLEQVDNSTVLLSADWFELMGGQKLALPTQLVGTVNYAESTITFDGRWLYNGQLYSQSAFGIGYYTLSSGEMLVFFSGDSGNDPITVKFDENGYLTEISNIEYGVYGDSYLGAYSYCPAGSNLYFLQAAAATQTTNLKSEKAPVEGLKFELKSGFTK